MTRSDPFHLSTDNVATSPSALRTAIPRRLFLETTIAGAAGIALAGCSAEAAGPRAPSHAAVAVSRTGPIIKPTPEADFIKHGEANAEARLERLWEKGLITPASLFFVRNHGATPVIDAKSWKLIVHGSGLDRPFELTYGELLKLPSKTVTRYLECAGNGRAFFKDLLGKEAQGDPWRLGAFGVAEWTGVPLSEILGRAGVKKSAVSVMPVGLDGSEIKRPMPIAKAMEEDTLLAYRMNGEDLPLDHGFPARILVPGWAGAASIKWVGRIQVSDTPLYSKLTTTDYVLIGPDYPPEPPADGPVVTTQTVKSAVALPWGAKLRAGRNIVRGYAWSPNGAIARVDVSLNGGKTWEPAELVGPNLPRAGVRWELSLEARAGEMTITPRATDEAGISQPELSDQRWNKKGYLFGAVVSHPISIVAG
ncbi:MAG: sulfite oxidase [Polyangiaceae bacterium]|nr:sulfite oxidase [Polyangiaceae bacterium]NUQ74155.1 sulfite oxidase [Polyangiaceae bacterium]